MTHEERDFHPSWGASWSELDGEKKGEAINKVVEAFKMVGDTPMSREEIERIIGTMTPEEYQRFAQSFTMYELDRKTDENEAKDDGFNGYANAVDFLKAKASTGVNMQTNSNKSGQYSESTKNK